MQDLISVRKYNKKIDAELDKSFLVSAGIKSIIKVDDAGGANPGIVEYYGIDLMVEKKNLKMALQLLNEHNKKNNQSITKTGKTAFFITLAFAIFIAALCYSYLARS